VIQLPKLRPCPGQLQATLRCVWFGGGHLHRECPEKTNTVSTPRCCNCTLVGGEKPHLASYRGCSHAKGEGHNEHPRDPLGGRSSLSPPHHSSPKQLHCVKTNNISNHKQRKQSSTNCHKRNFWKKWCQYRIIARLIMNCSHCSASDHDRGH
jgi:hypothetical protein